MSTLRLSRFPTSKPDAKPCWAGAHQSACWQEWPELQQLFMDGSEKVLWDLPFHYLGPGWLRPARWKETFGLFWRFLKTRPASNWKTRSGSMPRFLTFLTSGPTQRT